MKVDKLKIQKIKMFKGMNRLENTTKKMFHEIEPELERELWLARDNNDLKRLTYLNSILDKITDSWEVDEPTLKFTL